MKIGDTAHLNATPEDVFDSLQDPEVLAATIPGVQKLDKVGDDHYTATIVAGVAAIKGSFTGEVTLSEQSRPDSFVLTASGAGAPGTVKAIVTVRLAAAEQGGTELTYEADAVVGGMIGGVGQRMITGVAKKMAGVFFTTVDEVIANGIPDVAHAAPDSSPDGVAHGSASGTASGTVGTGTSSGTSIGSVTRTSPGADALVGLGTERGFAAGVVAGAVIALIGAAVGARLGRRR